MPLSGGRHANQWFGKQRLSLIERFTNGLMRRGPNSGKKSTRQKISLPRIYRLRWATSCVDGELEGRAPKHAAQK